MNPFFLRSFLVCLIVATVINAAVENLNEDLDYNPQVAISCDKVTRHVDVNTGAWIVDKNSSRLCTTDRNEILKYCQAVYPSRDIRNIVEANNRVKVDNSLVTPYRCLAGSFESDALLVPQKCRFEHMHYDSQCKSHDEWRKQASDKCKSENMTLGDYGVLIPCEIGLFTGVEFVCCPEDGGEIATEAVKVVDVSVVSSTSKPVSVLEHLKSEISKFAKHVEASLIGCDPKKYHDKRDQMEDTHRQKVQDLLQQWQQAEKRYKLLKSGDENQATGAVADELESFKNMLNSFDDQAKLERLRLKEEHHQCTQINLNDKKNQALRDFVAAIEEEPRDGDKIKEALKRYLTSCTKDRLHNLRYFEYVQKHRPEKAEEAREALQTHLKLINNLVNESLILLYKLPEIALQFQVNLPDWIPKPPALPTEKPTIEKSSAAKDPTDPPSKGEEYQDETVSEKEDPITKAHGVAAARKTNDDKPSDVKPDRDDDVDDVTENEEGEFRKRYHSQATFSAVIGLSCGALVIMVIIVVAMAMRRSRPRNNTKTVLVDGDEDNATEKSHLVNMQENGYENPTYRFYDY